MTHTDTASVDTQNKWSIIHEGKDKTVPVLNCRTMKTYEGVQMKLHAFLSSL